MKSALTPRDLKAFELIAEGRMTVAMAPLYGPSVPRLIAAGLARRGADGRIHLVDGPAPLPPGPAPVPVPPPMVQVVFRMPRSLIERLDELAAKWGVNRSVAVRYLLERDPPSAGPEKTSHPGNGVTRT